MGEKLNHSKDDLYGRFRRVSKKLRVVAYLFQNDGPRDFVEEDIDKLDEGVGFLLNDLTDELMEIADEIKG